MCDTKRFQVGLTILVIVNCVLLWRDFHRQINRFKTATVIVQQDDEDLLLLNESKENFLDANASATHSASSVADIVVTNASQLAASKSNRTTYHEEPRKRHPQQQQQHPQKHPQQQEEIQMDIMVPQYRRDDRLKLFAEMLGAAIREYHYPQQQQQQQLTNSTPTITTFRLLITRFTAEEQQPQENRALQMDLSNLTRMPLSNIVMVHAPLNQTFSRGRAMNLLLEQACSESDHQTVSSMTQQQRSSATPKNRTTKCLMAGIDVDMQVRPEFFQHSVEVVILQQTPPKDKFNNRWIREAKKAATKTNNTIASAGEPSVAYFPIVWSAYNPRSIQLVEEFFQREKKDPHYKLPEYSEHTGHWRHYGTGMYVLLKDPNNNNIHEQLRFDATLEGWGLEDGDFSKRLQAMPQHYRIMRRTEPGLVHLFHPKLECEEDKHKMKEKQYKNCLKSARREEGSSFGQKLLLEEQQKSNTTKSGN